ncbi:DUF6314 family protein [Microvirga sp. W0021]|uniref:DUF6314 family protein n=1 Tax=Hohaiivirga grylli TaxID=3133970 RepID=A0ABV0BLI6_9HYPH
MINFFSANFTLPSFLTGQWQLQRLGWIGTGEGKRQIMRMSGQAEITETDDGLLFSERGVMHFDEYHGSAERQYLFRPVNPTTMQVFFDDGRYFHEMAFSGKRADVYHMCMPDDYSGRYRILDQDSWCLNWRIIGPHKNSLISSRFQRIHSN